MKPGDLVMDICEYSDIEGLDDRVRIGVVISIIEVDHEGSLGKFDPDALDIVEVLMEDGTFEEFEVNELTVINENR
tara:strand:+ start:886 stop:1113 length:228 start_codon:yes stop_codon:yes gene_type:complete